LGTKSSSVALFNRAPPRRINRNIVSHPIRAAAVDKTVTLLDYGENIASLVHLSAYFLDDRNVYIIILKEIDNVLTIVVSSIA
jgi:hypothetical protein